MASASKEIPATIGRNGAALLLSITPQRVDQLVRINVLPKIDRGQYDPIALVAAYAEFRAGEAERRNRSESADSLRDARAEEIRMRMAIRQRQLIPLDDAETALSYFCGRFIQFVEGLPAAITKQAAERARIQDVCDSGRLRLCADFDRATEALREGSDPYGQ